MAQKSRPKSRTIKDDDLRPVSGSKMDENRLEMAFNYQQHGKGIVARKISDTDEKDIMNQKLIPNQLHASDDSSDSDVQNFLNHLSRENNTKLIH